MSVDNYFATFLGKRGPAPTRPTVKRARSIEVVEDSPHSLKTTSIASTVASPNAAEGARESLFPAAASLSGEIASASVETVTATKARLRRAEEDDEEEELRLLLGGNGRGSSSLHGPPPPHASPPSSASAPVLAPDTAGSASRAARHAELREDDMRLRDLPWATGSNAVLEAIAERFEAQFRWELQQNATLLELFEPFFRDRALDRIRSEKSLRCQFHPAGDVTAENTAVAGGYALRSYQLDGVRFLLDHFHRGVSCILADDMGLGKTAQIATFLHTLKLHHGIDGPHLIVAPLSTLTGWTRELARWAPSLRVVKYHGERSSRAALRGSRANRHCVFVTTPSLLHQDRGFFRHRAWVAAVVDEAHVLKGQNTMITCTARRLTACFRLAVTGTPVHNNAGEVWSLMGFLYPSHCARYDAGGEADPLEAAEDCARLLQQIMLRRTKGSLELGIPPRVDAPTQMLEATAVQRLLLARMTLQALDDDTDTGSAMRLQVTLTHQRIVCNHPLALRLVAVEGRGSNSSDLQTRLAAAGIALEEASIVAPSAKMVELDRLLRELKAAGHRCLIFSNFTSVLDLLQALCVLRGYSHERLDGTTQRVERELSMIRFNAPGSDCFAFLLTTTAGGVGVTLTGADTVILFDAHFNPQIDRQAADRAHRIGQTRTVHVHRLCLRNTVEERILSVALRKASLGDFIVDGGAGEDGGEGKRRSEAAGTGGGGLSVERIRHLFSSSIASCTDVLNSWSADGTHTAADEAMVEDLMRVEANGLPASLKSDVRPPRAVVGVTHHCFCCGDIMRPLMPLYHCSTCPKAYHAECVGERPLGISSTAQRMWTCVRHSCSACGKGQAVDGAVFMCTECPLAFCFDCLDPRYFDLDEGRTQFVHIRRTYAGMEVEGMDVRRSVYYITCLRCCGVLSSSSSSSSSSAGEDGSEAASDNGDATSDEDNDGEVEIIGESD